MKGLLDWYYKKQLTKASMVNGFTIERPMSESTCYGIFPHCQN